MLKHNAQLDQLPYGWRTRATDNSVLNTKCHYSDTTVVFRKRRSPPDRRVFRQYMLATAVVPGWISGMLNPTG